MNPSDTPTTRRTIEVVLPMLIDEYAIGYLPPQVGMELETEIVPIILEIRIPTKLPGCSTEKHYGSCKSKYLLSMLMKD